MEECIKEEIDIEVEKIQGTHLNLSSANIQELSDLKLSSKEKAARVRHWVVEQTSIPSSEFIDPEECYDENMELSMDDLKSKKRKFLSDDSDDFECKPPKKRDTYKRRVVHIDCEWIGCRYNTTDYAEFQTHVKGHLHEVLIKSYNDGTSVYVCLWDLCDFESADDQTIKRHVNYHTYQTRLRAIGKSYLYILQECYKESSTRNKLPILTSDFLCRWVGCTLKFTCIQEFFDHVKCHALGEQENGKSLTCYWLGCKKRFPNITNLFRHTKFHTSEKEFACYNCGSLFTNKQKLVDHCDRQAKLSEYKCTECPSIFGSLTLLNSHMRYHRCAHKCEKCMLSFTARSTLITHIRRIHVNDKPLKCHLCSYECVGKNDLVDHLNRHDKKGRKWLGRLEGRIYACHYCDHGYSRGIALTKHLIRQHKYKLPSNMPRFKYYLTDDGLYKLNLNPFCDSLGNSTDSTKSIRKRNSRKKTVDTDDSSKDNNYRLVQCNEETAEKIASYILLKSDEQDSVCLDSILAIQKQSPSDKVDTDFKKIKNSKKKPKKSRKSKKQSVKTKKEPKVKKSKDIKQPTRIIESFVKILPPRNTLIKEEELDIRSANGDSAHTNHIEISIEDIDFHGNVVKREVVESHQLY